MKSSLCDGSKYWKGSTRGRSSSRAVDGGTDRESRWDGSTLAGRVGDVREVSASELVLLTASLLIFDVGGVKGKEPLADWG